jgi:hypothetical protein
LIKFNRFTSAIKINRYSITKAFVDYDKKLIL